MLQQAIETEVAAYISANAQHLDSNGHRLVVRNGYMPERDLCTGIGDIAVSQPRVNDKRLDSSGERLHFKSSILPPYLRRTKQIDEFIPWLYLKGISTGDFSEAFTSLTGQNIGGVSPTTVVRLKEQWQEEFTVWKHSSLADKRYVYFWADGVYFNIRLEDDRQCILVIIGALEDGKKEIIAIEDGYRESEISWTKILLDLKARGLEIAPKLAIADGALGFWAALEKVCPETRQQRCWVHKTANILNCLPKSQHDKAKEMIREIWMAESRNDATNAYNLFTDVYRAKYQKAVENLIKDKDELLAFYDFPAEHWCHIRTSNPIESMFATVRLRTKRTKGCGSSQACLMMVFKLAQSAQNGWRRLRGHAMLKDLLEGVVFTDGIKKAA